MHFNPGRRLNIEDPKAQDISTAFPMVSYRPGQKEAIERIAQAFESGKKFVLLSAPTGSGKSVIGYTLAKMLGRAYYLTSTKVLQSQLVGDFKDVVDLKGRNAYRCNYFSSLIGDLRQNGASMKEIMDATISANQEKNCASGHCKSSGGAKCRFADKCEYWCRLNEAIAADVCTMNYKSFLFQMMVGGRFDGRDLLVLDESHEAESELMSFISLMMSDKLLLTSGVRFEDLGSVQAYQQHFQEIHLDDVLTGLKALALGRDLRDYEEFERLEMKLRMFMQEDPAYWVYELRTNRDRSKTLEFKPLFVRAQANGLLFEKADKVLLMSATLLDHAMIRDMLGIPPKDCESITMTNRFPKENRPIYKRYAGSMNFRDKATTLPQMVKAVDDLCRHYQEHRGIIHTHNFEITNKLADECAPDVRERFLLQTEYRNKEEMLAEHAQRPNSIIVAPAMHAGLDLHGDLSRFQIICKVPYPNYKENKQLQMRMELNHGYLAYLSALKMVQSYGRSVRSEDDWADTYILDAEFERFYKQNRKMLPRWFLEAIKE